MAVEAEKIVTCIPEVTADRSHRPGAKYNLYITDRRLILEFAGSMAHSPVGFFVSDLLTGKAPSVDRTPDAILASDPRCIEFRVSDIESIKIKKSWFIGLCQGGRGCVMDVIVGPKRDKYWVTMETDLYDGTKQALAELVKDKLTS